jgi:cell division protein FtsI (penicillin-binding protein 3)
MTKEKVNIRKVFVVRVYMAFVFVVLFGAAIFWQAAKLQIYEKSKWLEVSRAQSTREVTVKAVRGNILAADGRLLATSVSTYELRWDFKVPGLKDVFSEKVDTISLLFSQKFSFKSKTQWKRDLKKWYRQGKRYQKIVTNVDYETVREMQSWPLLERGRYRSGLIAIEKNKRVRPFESLAKRTIGNLRGGASVGLEGVYDSLLAGKSGKRIEQKTYGGEWRPVSDDYEYKSENGLDVLTTINVELQDVAEQALMRTMTTNDANTGCVVLMEVETGAIKAIANLSKNSDGDYVDVLDHALRDATDPGSTFKLLSYMALLEDGYVKLEDTVDINWGRAQFYDREMKDAGTPSRTKLTVQECFEKSSNVGIATMIQKHYGSQPSKFIARVKKTSVDKLTGVELGGEGKPRVKSPEDGDWSGISLPWMSIGYESRVTPLGMLAIYNAVANGGKYMKPYLVSEIQSRGKTVDRFQPVVVNEKICSEETLEKLQKMLRGVVENGTARNLSNMGFPVAGKTGTAQLATSTGYLKNAHKASFAGYFPANDPKYSCIVVINNPKRGVYYGSLVAGPVFREIADKVYASSLEIHNVLDAKTNKNMPWVKRGFRTDIKDVLNKLEISSKTIANESDGEWVSARSKTKYMQLEEKVYPMNQVPSVKGMGLRDALFLLEERKLKVVVDGYGRVVSQSIVAGTTARAGQTILIKLRN